MKTDVCLQAITNILLVNNQCVKEYGLLNGKMGICLYLYEYARLINSVEYTDCADNILDEIINNINEVNDFDFSTGLPGIAFGINYLLKHKFVEGDPDDVLGEMESRIHRSIANYLHETKNVMPPLIISPIYFIYKGDLFSKKYLLNIAIEYIDRMLHSDTYLTSTCLNSMLFFLKNVKKHINLPPSFSQLMEKALANVKSQLFPEEFNLTQSLYAGVDEELTLVVCDNMKWIEFYTWQGFLYNYKIKAPITSTQLEEYIVNLSVNLDNEDLGFCKLSGIGLGVLKDIYR